MESFPTRLIAASTLVVMYLLSSPITSHALAEDVTVLPASLTAGGADLAVAQTRDAGCAPGGDCSFTITVTNNGPQPYAGTLNLLGASSIRLRSHDLSGPETVECSHKRSSVACRMNDLSLNAGQSVTLTLALGLPRTAKGEMKACSLLTFSGSELEDPLQDLMTIVQLALKQRGFYKSGEIDGKSGSKLLKAINAFREQESLGEGAIDQNLLLALFGPQGLLINDPNIENDTVCEAFDLPKATVSAAQARLNRRRAALRRARAQQQRNVQSAQPTTGDRKYNPRIDGLEP